MAGILVGLSGVGEGVALGSIMMNGGKKTSPMGVRKLSAQDIGVRICGASGGSREMGRAFSAFGSRLEFIPALTLQMGTIRAASCPTIMINKMPIGTTKTIRLQSRRSRSGIFMMSSPVLSLQGARQ